MKIDTVIIGGTYNPIHIGHMHLADEVMKAFQPERIIVVPSFISAHKKGERVAAAEHRLEMLSIACEGSGLIIEDCELNRKGVSYTIDTIKYIKQKYNLKDKPGLLIGDDLIKGFADWKLAEEVAVETQLIVAYRDFHDEIDFGYPHYRIDNLILNISSSEIRKRINSGQACRYLLPAGVYEYIVDNGLYGVK